MSSRNVGLSVGHAAAKANSGAPGVTGFGSAAWVGPGAGGPGAAAPMGAAAESGAGHSGERPMTERDLPPPNTKRWVMRRKAEVVAGVRCGLISLDEACRRYTLSVEEFLSWQRLIDSHGLRGLRATRLQDYRGNSDDDGGEGRGRSDTSRRGE